MTATRWSLQLQCITTCKHVLKCFHTAEPGPGLGSEDNTSWTNNCYMSSSPTLWSSLGGVTDPGGLQGTFGRRVEGHGLERQGFNHLFKAPPFVDFPTSLLHACISCSSSKLGSAISQTWPQLHQLSVIITWILSNWTIWSCSYVGPLIFAKWDNQGMAVCCAKCWRQVHLHEHPLWI